MATFIPIISSVATMASSFMQAGYQASAGAAQAQASYYNAAVAQNNANASLQAAYANKQQQDRENRARLEYVRSKYLSSGVELEGTPLLVMWEQTSQMALDSEKIMSQGKNQYTNFMNQANSDIYQGNVSLASSEAQSTGTILGGVAGGVSSLGRALYMGGK